MGAAVEDSRENKEINKSKLKKLIKDNMAEKYWNVKTIQDKYLAVKKYGFFSAKYHFIYLFPINTWLNICFSKISQFI